jgi:hypothetical protein
MLPCVDLGRALNALGRWLPDHRDRQRALRDIPLRLFAFGKATS